jgi:hypothetical protein
MDAQQPELSSAALAVLYEAKALAELDDAEAAGGATARGWRGEPLSRLAFVVSAMSPGEIEAGDPLRGEAGEAADKAAAALGVSPEALFVVASRPGADMPPEQRTRRLALALEAADPAIVIALDDDAACDLADAMGVEGLEPGRPVRVRGRVVGSVGGFAASLGDPRAKARVWAAMKAVAAEGGLDAKGRPKASLEARSEGADEAGR